MKLGQHDDIGMLWCWCVSEDKVGAEDHSNDVSTMYFGVRENIHTILYAWHASMWFMVVVSIMVTYMLLIL